jgi:hypothetical protein
VSSFAQTSPRPRAYSAQRAVILIRAPVGVPQHGFPFNDAVGRLRAQVGFL